MFQGMEYVYEVYLEKSFSKAAEKLFISQPSLSANVKRVEHHIGSLTGVPNHFPLPNVGYSISKR